MSPQVVDLNGDGHLDILAGTYCGTPSVAWGSKQGFAQPELLKTREGKRILFNQYWDYNGGKRGRWVYLDRKNPMHCTSAFAFDWDGDGDLDLLLGDFKGGRVFLRRNEGTATSPLFATTDQPVTAAGLPIKFTSRLSTMAMKDWTGDGRPDLVCGLMGRAGRSGASGGGVWVFPDTATAGPPRLGKGFELVGSFGGSKGGAPGPGAGFYFDVTDYDGDGDPDLLVGGRAYVVPAPRMLTPEEQKQADELKAERDRVNKERMAIYQKVGLQAGDRKDPGWQERYTKAMAGYRKELTRLAGLYRKLDRAYVKLVPRPQLENLVWLLTNQGQSPRQRRSL